mmetsp:Transcript_8138/g.24318  ORF Transcript_8138/g.24318 Transcript_8138/m.24318 type:complete len:419 (-) Transcript_8138:458-1714(-)
MTTTAAEEKKNGYLLDRIGGEPALEAAVDEFYSRVVSDATLGHFFDGITIEQLKEHQRKFLRMAFTRIPESIDVVKFMHSKHERLFLRGLNAEHFDTVAGHFVGTLEALGVGPSEIDEAVGVVGPLRPIFVEGAERAAAAAEEKDAADERQLLSRLGGDGALHAAVDEFYDRLMEDETLSRFFEGISVDNLKEHQRKFLRMAFTEIPASIDVVKFMHSKHERLFAMGLDETHFDAVAGHFVGTLNALGVKQREIDEAVGVVAPLRPIFEEGAAWANKHAEEEKKEETEDKTLFDRLGGEGAITAAVDEFYARVVVDNDLERFFVGVPLDVLKEHQRKFMKMAFTSVPEDVDVEKYMFTKHYRFFAMGLNESHFDKVAGHFVSTLQHLEVSQNLIDEAVGNIAPLRPVFEKGIKGRGKK